MFLMFFGNVINWRLNYPEDPIHYLWAGLVDRVGLSCVRLQVPAHPQRHILLCISQITMSHCSAAQETFPKSAPRRSWRPGGTCSPNGEHLSLPLCPFPPLSVFVSVSLALSLSLKVIEWMTSFFVCGTGRKELLISSSLRWLSCVIASIVLNQKLVRNSIKMAGI